MSCSVLLTGGGGPFCSAAFGDERCVECCENELILKHQSARCDGLEKC
uniref:Uncharacterized protein n=1 Tax=Anguilla anguilla TaxID=7936 RepID=A0A0E9PXC7_ANGAN